jgi:hypothetical protein
VYWWTILSCIGELCFFVFPSFRSRSIRVSLNSNSLFQLEFGSVGDNEGEGPSVSSIALLDCRAISYSAGATCQQSNF